MATTKESYSSWSQLTITLNSLANSSARQSAVIDNTSNLYLDILLGFSFKTASGSLATNPLLNIWIAPLAYTDGSPTDHYSGTYGTNTVGGGDGSYTMPSNTGDLVLGAALQIITAAETEYKRSFSVASLFGTLPSKFVVIVQNSTGLALDSSAGGAVYWQGEYKVTA